MARMNFPTRCKSTTARWRAFNVAAATAKPRRREQPRARQRLTVAVKAASIGARRRDGGRTAPLLGERTTRLREPDDEDGRELSGDQGPAVPDMQADHPDPHLHAARENISFTLSISR